MSRSVAIRQRSRLWMPVTISNNQITQPYSALFYCHVLDLFTCLAVMMVLVA